MNVQAPTQPLSQRRRASTYRPDIDGLRAIAVLAVVVYHAFPTVLTGGFVGVDIFFVLSGYLISGIIAGQLQASSFSFWDFYSRRIRRIFPALILVFIACYLLGWFVLIAAEYAQLGKHMAAGAVFLSNFALLHESGYFDTASELKPLLHLWSLAIEEQFYIVWPLLLWLAFKAKLRPSYLIGLGFALSFATNISTVITDPTAAFYTPWARAWELLIGAGLAVYLQGGAAQPAAPLSAPTANRFAALGLALIVSALVLLDKTKSFPGWWALLPTTGTVLLLYAGTASPLSQSVLANRWLVNIGLVSYPLYLWHWPIFSFARIISGGELSPLAALMGIVAALALALLTYRYWERLLRHQGSKTAIGLLCAMLVVGYAGWNVSVREGIDSRYKKTLTYSDALKRDFASWESKGMYPVGTCTPSFDYPKATICAQSKPLPAAFDTVVFGDSHAFHAYWGVAKAFGDAGHVVKLIGKGGCNFLRYEQDSVCQKTYQSQVAAMTADPNVKQVLISHRAAIGASSSEADTQIFFKTLEVLFATLTQSGKSVVYLLPVPELAIDPRLCGAGLPMGRQLKLDDCEFPLERVRTVQTRYRQLLAPIAQKYPALSVFDTPAALCDDGKCQVIRNGQTGWTDNNHISESASYNLGMHLIRDRP